MSDHLVELVDGWSVWRWVFVRGAGFPATGVLALAAADAAGEADTLIALDERITRERAALLVGLDTAIESGSGEPQQLARAAARKLRKGNLVAAVSELATGELAASARAITELEASRTTHADRFERVLERESEAAMLALEATARDPRFREAVTWQNRAAIRTGLDRLLARPPGRGNSSDRNHAQLVASYLQRYCVKNDSIGFFGPIGWGSFVPDATGTVRGGRDVVSKRTIYFEHWCIDTLASVLAADPELKPQLYPRQLPSTRLDGQTLTFLTGGDDVTANKLPIEFARVLAACDGTRTASAIADQVAADTTLELERADVFEALAELEHRNLCTWTIEIPTVTEFPERHLRAALEQVAEPARTRALAVLDEIEAARDHVATTAGDPLALDGALEALDTTFERVTSAAATRKRGEMYAARTLVYEECRRDFELEVGTPVLERLAPLRVLLPSARWYSYRLAQRYREVLEQAYDELAAQGDRVVDFRRYLRRVRAIGEAASVKATDEELQRRWSEIVTFPEGARRVELRTSELAARVRDVFDAPHPGWPGARYHAPDVMIAAASADVVAAGGGTYVLGEFHPTVCTQHFFAQKEHADRAALTRARELDLPEIIPYQVFSKEDATRADHMWISSHDLDIETGRTRSWRPRSQVIAVADLVVERRDRGVVVRDRDERWCFEAIEVFGPDLGSAVSHGLPMFAARPHTPRVMLDGMVIQREQWRMTAPDLGFPRDKATSSRFLGARAWANQHAMPRWVFMKIPEEPKPVFVDFQSPIYVEALCKLLRKASVVSISEMMPSVDETWLPDAGGRTYACELRIVLVDPMRWRPAINASPAADS